MRFWRLGVWVGAVAVTGAVLAVAIGQKAYDDTTKLTTVLGFVLSVTGLAVNLLKTGPPVSGMEPASAERLDRAAEQLAEVVREQWQSEWRLRRLQDPEPLQVRWGAAEVWLSDHQENIGAEPFDLPDRLDHITDAHGRVPSGRPGRAGRTGQRQERPGLALHAGRAGAPPARRASSGDFLSVELAGRSRTIVCVAGGAAG
jgi:hypothetical protein